MSEDAGIEIPRTGDSAFGALMDVLVADETAEAPAEDAAPVAEAAAEAPVADAAEGEPAGAAGTPVPPAEPDTGADAGAGTGADAAADTDADAGGGEGAESGADARPAGGDRWSSGAVDVATIAADLTGLGQKFEETTTEAFKQASLAAVSEEYKPYFDALNKHPRLLVGTQVPDLNSDDENALETLRDAEDAKSWQEAVKSLLTEEVQERTRTSMEENKDIIDTVHASIEIFTKNKDLVPGTKQFNKPLADRFAAVAKPYELRIDGRLHGYTIPVQPLIDQLRTQVGMEAKTPAAAPAAAAPAKKAKPKADPPQRGIRSKAGSGSEAEDFSTLFGTLGLPDISRQ